MQWSPTMLPLKKSCRSLALTCRRNASSKAKLQSPHDKRMEALVSLYHQSNTFITPENLSTVIDQVFTQPLNIAEEKKKHTFAELFRMKKDIRESPKFFLGRDSGNSYSDSMGPGWTESRTRRVDRVHQALMGTQNDGRPSWVSLKENSKRVEYQIGEDKRE